MSVALRVETGTYVTERRESRTDLAVGYTAVPVLKTCGGRPAITFFGRTLSRRATSGLSALRSAHVSSGRQVMSHLLPGQVTSCSAVFGHLRSSRSAQVGSHGQKLGQKFSPELRTRHMPWPASGDSTLAQWDAASPVGVTPNRRSGRSSRSRLPNRRRRARPRSRGERRRFAPQR
jgi:hypothetical protein